MHPVREFCETLKLIAASKAEDVGFEGSHGGDYGIKLIAEALSTCHSLKSIYFGQTGITDENIALLTEVLIESQCPLKGLFFSSGHHITPSGVKVLAKLANAKSGLEIKGEDSLEKAFARARLLGSPSQSGKTGPDLPRR